MRVVAGRAKGPRLAGPPSRATRPTSDLVRGAIFSALDSLGADLSRTLDLYAGSGALGVEALSRGAQRCDFVERDARACASIRPNLSRTGPARRGWRGAGGGRRAGARWGWSTARARRHRSGWQA